jgi:dihydroorotate dehydrogenase
LKAEQQKLAAHSQRNVPLVVKLAPDQEAGEIQSICEIFNELEIEGVIATNTTLSRAGVEGLEHASEAGGLSGRPLLERSTEVVRTLRQYLNPDIALIAAGGISSAEDMQLKIDAGADLVQIYSGFIYRGPALVKELVRVT